MFLIAISRSNKDPWPQRKRKRKTGVRGRSWLLTTALSQMTDIRSSVPLVPSGMRVKLSFPTAFWAVLKVQWALPVTWRSPLDRKHIKMDINSSSMTSNYPWISSFNVPEQRKCLNLSLRRQKIREDDPIHSYILNQFGEVTQEWQDTNIGNFWYFHLSPWLTFKMALTFIQNPYPYNSAGGIISYSFLSAIQIENKRLWLQALSATMLYPARTAWSEESSRRVKSLGLTKTARNSESPEWSGQDSGVERWRKLQPWPNSCSSSESHQFPSWRWWAHHTPQFLPIRTRMSTIPKRNETIIWVVTAYLRTWQKPSPSLWERARIILQSEGTHNEEVEFLIQHELCSLWACLWPAFHTWTSPKVMPNILKISSSSTVDPQLSYTLYDHSSFQVALKKKQLQCHWDSYFTLFPKHSFNPHIFQPSLSVYQTEGENSMWQW